MFISCGGSWLHCASSFHTSWQEPRSEPRVRECRTCEPVSHLRMCTDQSWCPPGCCIPWRCCISCRSAGCRASAGVDRWEACPVGLQKLFHRPGLPPGLLHGRRPGLRRGPGDLPAKHCHHGPIHRDQRGLCCPRPSSCSRSNCTGNNYCIFKNKQLFIHYLFTSGTTGGQPFLSMMTMASRTPCS